jgi:ParB family chromosome partitioning protein
MSKMDPKPRLGRGLSSLISISKLPVEAEIRPPVPTVETPQDIANAITPPSPHSTLSTQHSALPTEIPTADITPNPHQPRRQFNESSLADLAASMKSNGLIQPIIVRRVDGRYQLIAGERRLRAAKLAGLSAIPAIVRDVDPFSQAQMALVENIHREDLNVMDRATAYRTLMDQLGLTQAELAQRLGEDRSTIANYVRLMDLAEPVKQFVRDEKLSLGHAKLLAAVSDILEQERLSNLVVSQDLSVRNLEKLLQNPPLTPPPAKGKTEPSAHLQELEKSFARQLGMRVQIHSTPKKGKGKVVIHYASLDQFDQLLAKLGVQTDET